MKLFKPSIELVVIRDKYNPANNIEHYQGRCIEKLLKEAFGEKGLSPNVRLYHKNLLNDVTPETASDVDQVMKLKGRIYAVVHPLGLEGWVISLIISMTVAVAAAFMMPKLPDMNGNNQPPSPNNALSARTNRERLGGRVPDIYGTVWSVPDLIAPTYSVYVNNREVEFSYMCIGRGRFNVIEALDDTTPINQVFGSSVMVFDPDDSLNDTPDFLFGSAFTPDEAALSRLAVKRYTSVNGQLLPPTDNFLTLDKAVFRAGGIIEQSGFNFASQFVVGDKLTVVQANPADSANGIKEPPETGDIVKYNLSGVYTISALAENTVTLSNPNAVNTDWGKLATNADYTVPTEATISTSSDALWQGYFYTNAKDHEYVLLNILATNGLYITDGKKYEPIGLEIEIESEIVDVSNNPVTGTLQKQTEIIHGSQYKRYAINNGVGVFRNSSFWWSNAHVVDDEAAQSAGTTVKVTNTNMGVGKRLRFRVRRKHKKAFVDGNFTIAQDLRIADFYGARLMTAADAPKGVTTVYTKTLATEGALSLKERKLRLLVQRYVTDATSGLPKLSNRADDIIRHIATDSKIGNLDLSQVDIAQIKSEVDILIAYFGTAKCAEFCGTFDDNNLSAEETLQTVARAVFSQAKRQGNKVMLDFERLVPASVAVFNSHNILPDTYTAPQSFGINNDYDGVKIEYTDPVDDAVITLSYPSEVLSNPHEEKLVGVRNKIQAHIHAMRLLNRDKYTYKSCEFTAGDESNIVVRTNRVTVAEQLRADVQQGSIDSIVTVGSDIIMYVDGDALLTPSGQYTAFIQTVNNGVEAIAVTANDGYSVKLARLPSGEISSGAVAVQAVYQIVSNDDMQRDAYLVAEKSPSEGMTNKLTCTNYDNRFYQNDTDYINGFIALN